MISLVWSQVILDDVQSWSLLAERLDDDAWTSANLSWFAFLVDLAQPRPFAELLAAVDADQWDLVLAAQSSDELLVLRLIAAFGQDAEHSLTSRKRKQCHWLLFGLNKIQLQIDTSSWRRNQVHNEFNQSTKVSSDPFSTHLSRTLQAWWIPWTSPSETSDFFSTSCNAVFKSIGPSRATGALTSLKR